MGERNGKDNTVEDDDVEDGKRLGCEQSLGQREEDHSHVDDEESEISEEDAYVATDVLDTPLAHL